MYPQVFGKYVLERELARGGMARVVLATLRGAGGFEKKLVVKQVRDELARDEEFVGRFVEEAKTTVALAHPNIVPVYELGVELGTYFLAMEYVEGASLAEVLRGRDERRPLSPAEGAYVGVEICRALDYAHRRMNVVHRDVTPRNVMVDEEGHVKVIDFGISAPVATAPSGHGVFGSPGHMPPEQMEGKELTPAADVFAVAVLLMELWSGRPAFRRKTASEVREAMLAPHPKPSDADIRLLPLDLIIAKAMSLDSKSRPQNADDLARTLRKFLSDVDLGDVAHRLGARVREVRRAPPAAAASETKTILQRPPSRPTATQVASKTFAKRDGAWLGPSTRRITSSPPTRPSNFINRPAFQVGEMWPLGKGRAQKMWMLAAVAALGAGGIAFAGFHHERRDANKASIPASLSSSTMAVEPSSIVIPGGPPAVSAPASTSSPSGPPPISSQTVANRERAILVLLGDGTFVSVDGAPRGATPVRVPVVAGSHAVLFTFPATGESKIERVVVHPGERATLRSDFTGIVPSVRAER